MHVVPQFLYEFARRLSIIAFALWLSVGVGCAFCFAGATPLVSVAPVAHESEEQMSAAAVARPSCEAHSQRLTESKNRTGSTATLTASRRTNTHGSTCCEMERPASETARKLRFSQNGSTGRASFETVTGVVLFPASSTFKAWNCFPNQRRAYIRCCTFVI